MVGSSTLWEWPIFSQVFWLYHDLHFPLYVGINKQRFSLRARDVLEYLTDKVFQCYTLPILNDEVVEEAYICVILFWRMLFPLLTV